MIIIIIGKTKIIIIKVIYIIFNLIINHEIIRNQWHERW